VVDFIHNIVIPHCEIGNIELLANVYLEKDYTPLLPLVK
jgi:hypothetical protein